MSLLLDTHAVHWWTAERERVSERATEAIRAADEVLVADITWLELAWLVRADRIRIAVPVRSWLEQIASGVRTIGITPAIAAAAASLPASFPKDPADRLIYATAIETGSRLVTKDGRLRRHRHPGVTIVW